mmetsp:Transcript_41235/g.57407  ORF Transcript_41235/g.57407 Transcript_41235/m.57407 type:complete len:157 (-) Transcript_41235:180-650(-)
MDHNVNQQQREKETFLIIAEVFLLVILGFLFGLILQGLYWLVRYCLCPWQLMVPIDQNTELGEMDENEIKPPPIDNSSPPLKAISNGSKNGALDFVSDEENDFSISFDDGGESIFHDQAFNFHLGVDHDPSKLQTTRPTPPVDISAPDFNPNQIYY